MNLHAHKSPLNRQYIKDHYEKLYPHIREEMRRVIKEKKIIKYYKEQEKYDNGEGSF